MRAKILIVGITPGWSQTQIAYRTAQQGILQKQTDEEIRRRCKIQSRFAGSMRRNLISMLDDLNLHALLGLETCAELISEESAMLHTTSLIKYPCFCKGRNYSGHAPSIASSKVLRRAVETLFQAELDCLKDARLIIPPGAAVENTLREMQLASPRILWGFPHPSGLNARRKDVFEQNRRSMSEILENCKF